MFRLITTIATLLTATPSAAVQVFSLPDGLTIGCESCGGGPGGDLLAGAFALSGTITLADGVTRVDAGAPGGVLGFDLEAAYRPASSDPTGFEDLTLDIAGDTAEFSTGAALFVDNDVLFADLPSASAVLFAGAENNFLVQILGAGAPRFRLTGRLTGPSGAISNTASTAAASGSPVALSAQPAVIPLPATAALLAGGLAALVAAGRSRRGAR